MPAGIRIRRHTVTAAIVAAVAAAAALGGPTVTSSAATGTAPYRAFSAGSYWNAPLPADAPVDQNSAEYISYMKTHSVHPYMMLSGLGSDYPAWGMPVFWADSTSPTYAVKNTCSQRQPAALASVRIPAGAQPSPDSDHEMTVYDRDRGIVTAYWHASFDATTATWSACGGSVYALGSNGLAGDVVGSDAAANFGHRGLPPSTFAIRRDEIAAGSIDHALKFGTVLPSPSFVFPLDGSDGKGGTGAPPEGIRMRIKPGVDLTKYGLSASSMVVARALQSYGAVLGDSSGGPTSVKVENCAVEGRGDCWTGLLNSFSLKAIPLDAYEVVRAGWVPPASPGVDTSATTTLSTSTSTASASTSTPRQVTRPRALGRLNLQARAVRHRVVLRWQRCPAAVAYDVWRDGVRRGRTTGTHWSTKRLARRTVHHFQVRPVGVGSSQWSSRLSIRAR